MKIIGKVAPDGTIVRMEKAAKSGEGSRGGHIIGHTKSGKPIYKTHGEGHHAKAHPHIAEAVRAAASDVGWHHSKLTPDRVARYVKSFADARDEAPQDASHEHIQDVLDEFAARARPSGK